jgi:uridine kinase
MQRKNQMEKIIFIIGKHATGKSTLAKVLISREQGWFLTSDEFQRLNYSVIPKAIKIIVCEEPGTIDYVVDFACEAPAYMKRTTLIITSNYISKEHIKDAFGKYNGEVSVFELA